MRTTIRLGDDLLGEARKLAAEQHTTLTALIEQAIRERLLRRRTKGTRPATRLPTFRGGGLQPGVDLDDSAALLDRMDARGR